MGFAKETVVMALCRELGEAEAPQKMTPCDTCKGTGNVVVSLWGAKGSVGECPDCLGLGGHGSDPLRGATR